jgi:hypothetical protein
MFLKSFRWRTFPWAVSCFPYAVGIAATLLLAALPSALYAQTRSSQPASSALQAVTLMASHEIADHKKTQLSHAFRFLSVERSSRTGGHLWTEEVVEVDGGLLRRLIDIDGKPLTPAQQAEEDHRLQQLAKDPDAFADLNHSRGKDEARVVQILERMPQEFLFQYDGEENGCRRIAYRPNPVYQPSSFEDRIIHNMAGFVEVREPSMRLCSVTGHLVKTVDFGWGLLGHLTQGSGFTLHRAQVEPSVWRSTRLNMQFDGAIFFFKSISRSQQTVRSHFQPIPVHLNLQQAVDLSLPSAAP